MDVTTPSRRSHAEVGSSVNVSGAMWCCSSSGAARVLTLFGEVGQASSAAGRGASGALAQANSVKKIVMVLSYSVEVLGSGALL